MSLRANEIIKDEENMKVERISKITVNHWKWLEFVFMRIHNWNTHINMYVYLDIYSQIDILIYIIYINR